MRYYVVPCSFGQSAYAVCGIDTLSVRPDFYDTPQFIGYLW